MIKRVIVLPDLQCPFQSKKSLKVVEQYIEEHVWDCLIIIGDFLDYYTISRFNEGHPGMLEGKTILKEIQEGEKVLDRLLSKVRAKNKECRVIYLEGNHEARAYQFATMFPHLKGMIEPEIALKLEEKGVEYYRSWSQSEGVQIGKAYFTHGRYTNMHHAKKMVESYDENVFYGHTHDVNSYNKTSFGTGKSKVGQSLGHLCLYPKEVDYTKRSPKNWQEAFATFYFQPSGDFNYYITRIFHNQFISPEGKLYK